MSKRHPYPMNTQELELIMSELGLQQLDLAALGDISNRSIQLWDPEVKNGFAVVLLRLLREHPQLLSEAWGAAGLPGGRRAKPRGRPKEE